MLWVLEECKNVEADFGSDPVHDLRVALRRCRSLADGLMALDPDPEWKAMKKAGKRLFQRLGELRDIQVMEEWIEKLTEAESHGEKGGPADDSEIVAESALSSADTSDPPGRVLLKILKTREQDRSAKLRLRWESLIANSGGAGASHFRHRRRIFVPATLCSSIWLWSAGH